MEFDPFGDVLACCANSFYPLGNVAESTLREIWTGPAASRLREAVAKGDHSLGCTICHQRVTTGGAELPMSAYDDLPVDGIALEWPDRLTFALHNTCNLACGMCGGDRSSRIRAQRDGQPPLARAYGDDFFQQLPPFLLNCSHVSFVGGEPFLIREHFRVWELMMDLGAGVRCGVTTNGTIWNSRVETVLNAFDTDISISVDGMSKQTFEAIRVGADFKNVMVNLERFRDYTEARGTNLRINWCFIRQNWFELGEALRFAEDLGVEANVQTVIEPEFGVQLMDSDELSVVLDTLERESEAMSGRLTLNNAIWNRQLSMLRDELERRSAGISRLRYMEQVPPERSSQLADVIIGSLRPKRDDTPVDLAELRRKVAREFSTWFGHRPVLDEMTVNWDGIILTAELGHVPVGQRVLDLESTRLSDFSAAVAAAMNRHAWVIEEFVESDHVSHTLGFGRVSRDKDFVLLKMSSFAVGDHIKVFVAVDSRFSERETRVVLRQPNSAEVR